MLRKAPGVGAACRDGAPGPAAPGCAAGPPAAAVGSGAACLISDCPDDTAPVAGAGSVASAAALQVVDGVKEDATADCPDDPV